MVTFVVSASSTFGVLDLGATVGSVWLCVCACVCKCQCVCVWIEFQALFKHEMKWYVFI